MIFIFLQRFTGTPRQEICSRVRLNLRDRRSEAWRNFEQDRRSGGRLCGVHCSEEWGLRIGFGFLASLRVISSSTRAIKESFSGLAQFFRLSITMMYAWSRYQQSRVYWWRGYSVGGGAHRLVYWYLISSSTIKIIRKIGVRYFSVFPYVSLHRWINDAQQTYFLRNKICAFVMSCSCPYEPQQFVILISTPSLIRHTAWKCNRIKSRGQFNLALLSWFRSKFQKQRGKNHIWPSNIYKQERTAATI